MMQISDVTGRRYEAEDCVFFRNYIQSAFYIAHGCELVDIFTDSKMKLVFVFWKKEHNNMIELREKCVL